MSLPHRFTLVVALLAATSPLALVAHPQGAFAQDEDTAAIARDLVDLARPRMERGAYSDAIRDLREARDVDPTNVDAALLLSRSYFETGRTSEAVAALAGLDGDARVLAARAALRFHGGDDEGAEAALRQALEIDENLLPARRLLGQILEETGRTDAAVEAYIGVNTRWARSEGEDTDEVLLAVARARLGVFRLAEEFRPNVDSILSRLEPIVRKDDGLLPAFVELGDLYLAMHQHQDAKRWYEKALTRNAHYAPAIFGMARQRAFEFDEDEAKEHAQRALRENPAYVPALLFLAQMNLGDGRQDEAEAQISTALTERPRDADALATRAALHFVRGDMKAFQAEVDGILARNGAASTAYLTTARVVEEQRRFREALVLGEKAVAVNPRDWDAHFLAGRNAMNVGDDARAEVHLRASEDGDIFRNVYRHNFLELFEKMQTFPVRDDPTFVVKLPLKEDDAYYALLRAELGHSLDVLEERWGFRPEYPLYISVFDQQRDFAARTIGLPGFPALGACFGRVVTLDSPRALPPGQFGWRGTLHHELAHVITLELSKGRVPRWLTEGLSVYEERKASPQWNREMERALIDAIASNEVLTLKDVNSAFRGPRVMYAYYQGGLMCEMVERDFGFPALREMVRLYGDGLDTPAVVRKALGVSPEEFDTRFLAFAKEYVAPLRVLARPSTARMRTLARELRRNKDDVEGWLLLAAGHAARGKSSDALAAISNLVRIAPDEPRVAQIRALVAAAEGRRDKATEFAEDAVARGADLFELRMMLAEAAEGAGDFEAAKAHLRKAIELNTVVTGGGSPRLRLAKLLMGEGDAHLDEAMALLRDHADIAEDDFGVRLRLVSYYRGADRTDEELATLLEIRDTVPLPNGEFGRQQALEIHERLGEIFGDRSLLQEAELAWRTAVGVARMETGNAADPPLEDGALSDLLLRHAQSLRAVGDVDEASFRAEEALRLDPENEDVQRLLERLRPE